MALDEGVVAERAESYRSGGCLADHGPREGEAEALALRRWKGLHYTYLRAQLWLTRDPQAAEDLYDPNDVDSTPETFRYTEGDPIFSATGLHVDLVRVETVAFVALKTGISRDDVWEMAGQTLVADSQAALDFEKLMRSFYQNIDARPVYAGFWSEAADLFGDEPTGDAPGWADRLRDRLGLAHHDPSAAGQPKRVFLFRYPAEVVPRRKGGERERRSLVVPTVLDGFFSEAFCPAPRDQPTGHVVHLRGEIDQDDEGRPKPRREVLHPRFAFRTEHLFRRGEIRKAVDASLIPEARGLHLDACRDLAGRPDYALGTDGDLR